eukprot:g7790.t1
MGFLNKFLRSISGPSTSKAMSADEKVVDDELRKLLKRLPNSTKRNLLQDLKNTDGGSTRALSGQGRGLNDRRASAPMFAAISEAAPVDEPTREMTAKDYAESLLQVEDLPELKDVKALHKALKRADETWVASFRENEGITGIYKCMAELAQSREEYLDDDGDDENEHEVPEEEVKLEVELVRCIMILLNKPQGFMTLMASSDLLPLLAGSAMDSSDNYVKCNLLKLLTIVTESGPSGFESVTNALDHVKVDKDEDLRFALLVEAFGDADSSGVALVTDLIVLFNTILSSAFEFEERVMLRTEMIAAGILEAMQRIRDYFGLSKDDDDAATDDWGEEEGRRSRRSSVSSDSSVSTLMMDAALASETNELAAQLDLFDTVMNEDMKDAKENLSATGGDGGADGGVGGVGGPPQQFLPDPPAVASMRSVIDKLQDKAELRVMVEVIAANMERMVDIKCDDKQWKKLRDAASSALDTAFLDSDSDDDDDDGGFGGKGKPAPKAGEGPVSPVPPPASRSPPAAPPTLPPSAGTIPPPPPAPGMPAAGAIPPPPALPGMPARGAIPPPPALPEMPAAGAIPPPPALPGLPAARAIPPPPALPGMPARGAIPPPPTLPGMPAAPAGIPPPPALPGMAGGRGPPPPPPLPGGGPPMPPPLPGIGGPRGPPPLPGMPRALAPPPKLPVKPKGPKRRPVHWDKIAPANLEQTVFSEINPSSVELPMELLQESFAEKPKEKKTPDKDAKDKESAAQAAVKKAAEKVELLDAKTLRNTGIAFKRFRMKPEDLRDSLVAMDLDKFDTDKFIALRNISPSPDQLPTLKGYEGDLAKLDEVTLFMVLTAKIPRYTARLDCALFIKGFSTDAEFLTEKLGLVSEAVVEVVDSDRLKRLIEVVLAMGNYLNEGTRNGDAKAIKLASLLKLETVKTQDKKKTLMHVLMSWAKDKEPDLLKLDEDLEHSSEASQWSLPDLKQQVTQLTKGFTLMHAQLKLVKGGVTKVDGDKFADVVEPFLAKAQSQMDDLEADFERVQKNYDDAAKRFGEDPTKVPSGDFFSLVSSLLDSISVALRDNDLQAKAEERRKKREAQEKKRREAKARRALDRKASDPPHMSANFKGNLATRPSIRPSRPSIRPSDIDGFGRGDGQRRRGLDPGARSGRGGGGGDVGSELKPMGVDINHGLLNTVHARRGLIAVGPDDDDDSDSDWDEQGAIEDEYDRIKAQRVNEAVMFRKISKLQDPGKREIARGQLPYQKSTIGLGRQQSMVLQPSQPGRSGSPAMLRQVSAVRQASNLRAMTAIRQASTVGGPNMNMRGTAAARQASMARFGQGGRRASGLAMGGRMASTLGPSNAVGGLDRLGRLSAGRLEGGGPPGFSRRNMSADYQRKVAAVDPRKQFKPLKSTAFLG